MKETLIINPNAVYSRADTMTLLGIGDVTMRNIVSSGKIKPSVVSKKKYRFLGSDLLEFLRNNKPVLSKR